MQAVFLELMDVVFRPLHCFPRQDAFALLVYLYHVELSFLPRPTEHLLENVRDVIHEIHRVIPTNHEVARVQAGLRLLLGHFDCAGGYFRRNGLCHSGKLEEDRAVVEKLHNRKMRPFLKLLRLAFT